MKRQQWGVRELGDPGGVLKQSRWRKVGATALAVAVVMAVYAVRGGVLRDTVIHLVHIFSSESPDTASAERPGIFCGVYWSIFVAALMTCVYMAMLDIRFIRLRYAVEKRRLIKQSMEDEDLRVALLGEIEKEETD